MKLDMFSMIVSWILGAMNLGAMNQNYIAGRKTLEISKSTTLFYKWKIEANRWLFRELWSTSKIEAPLIPSLLLFCVMFLLFFKWIRSKYLSLTNLLSISKL